MEKIDHHDDGIGFTPIAAIINGGSIPDNMDPGLKFYKQLKPNIGMLGGDEELTQALLEADACTMYNCCERASERSVKGAPVAWLVPEEGVVLERDALGTQKFANTYWAMKYIDFALSEGSSGKLVRPIGHAAGE